MLLCKTRITYSILQTRPERSLDLPHVDLVRQELGQGLGSLEAWSGSRTPSLPGCDPLVFHLAGGVAWLSSWEQSSMRGTRQGFEGSFLWASGV